MSPASDPVSGPRTLAIAAPHGAATEAGREAFVDGGTAVDAALAACATLAVVCPDMCSIGGDAIALVRAPDGTVTCVNGSGAAPAALDAARVRAALERDPAPLTRTGMPWRGPHTVTVPGVLAAWETLRGLGARHDLARLLRPAIERARDGCPVSRPLAESLRDETGVFAGDPGLREVFFSGGQPADGAGRTAQDGAQAVLARAQPLGEGDILRQPALAASLETIARDGVGAFYEGALGGDFVAGLRALGSVMTTDDLRRHVTEVGEPLRGEAFGLEFLTAPPNSQGYVLLQLMGALDAPSRTRRDDAAPPDPLGSDADILARLFRLTGDERDRVLCDPRSRPVPLDDLLSRERLAALAGASRRDAPTSGGEPFAGGTGDRPAHGDTIACVAADSEGWAVSVIQSVYQAFGAAILEPRTGIVAHDRGACFSLDPASPNVVAGGKRPLHTLMPLLVCREGRPLVVAGTMGGEAQPQIHTQIVSHLLRSGALGEQERTGGRGSSRPGAPGGGGRPDSTALLQAAVSAPRWIDDEGELIVESSVPDPCRAALRATGIPVAAVAGVDSAVGHAQYVLLAGGCPVAAASDPRAGGSGLVDGV